VVAELQRADVFALPMRTRLAGLNPEGLGWRRSRPRPAACRSWSAGPGGAPETVLPGRTGFVVEPDDPTGLADRLTACWPIPPQAGDGCGGPAVRR
jgi:phosphatidylinositol alpha-1,6-mannosyltransferase